MKSFRYEIAKTNFICYFRGTYRSLALPVVGGVVGGTLTYVSFKSCCDKLKESLEDTLLSNPNHISDEAENIIIDIDLNEDLIIDVEE